MRRTRAGLLASAIALACLSTSPIAAGATENAKQVGEKPVFTFDRVEQALTAAADTRSVERGAVDTHALGLDLVELGDRAAVVNRALVRADGTGAISAATAKYVDLSWSPIAGADTYKISKDGRPLAVTESTSFRDVEVMPGDGYHYQIAPMFNSPDQDGPLHGLGVLVPAAPDSDADGLQSSLRSAAAEIVKYTTATLYWYTFIPQAKIDAPPVGVPGISCEYADGYQFGGDNRGFESPNGQGDYRARINGNIFWASNSVDLNRYIQPTTVYNKSTGELVDQRQLPLSDATFEFRRLGGDANTMDIRVGMQAGNPFCTGNSIEGAFTITVTRSGNYSIISGAHRQMPNHEIYLHGSSPTIWGAFTPIYQRPYLDPICLVQMACPTAQMSGYYGEY